LSWRFSVADASPKPIVLADDRRRARDLETARFSGAQFPTETAKGFGEERADIARLQPASFGAFHLFADCRDDGRIHALARQFALPHKRLDALAIHRAIDRLKQARPDFRPLTVTDRLHQQFAQRSRLEQLAEDVVDAPAEGAAGLFELVE
jgi:hypothetical protein